MNNGERPVHIMHWAPQDWLSSPLRAQLALERDHVARLLYRELLDAIHAAGGRIRRSEIPGAVMLSAEEVDLGLVRLLQSGRVVERGGFISNPRVRKEIDGVLGDRKRDAERKRLEREEKDAKRTGANVRRSPPDKPGCPDVSGAPSSVAYVPSSPSPNVPTDQARSVPRPADEPPAPANGNGAPRAVTQADVDAWWGEVWPAWCRKRGGDGRKADSVEFALARRWLDSGVPLRIVLRGIEDCSEKSLGPSKRLVYVGPAVDEAIARWRRGMSGSA